MEKVIKMTLIRSMAGCPQKQRATLIGLGLRRMNRTVVRQDLPEIQGMLRKVQHLVRVEE